MNNIKQVASLLSDLGRNGDTMLAHITPEEAMVLREMGGAGSINPITGLPEFWGIKSFTKAISNVGNAVADVVSNPVKAVKDVGSAIDDAVIAPVVKAGSELDDFVNNEIPGGWVTVAALTGAALAGPEVLAAGEGTTAPISTATFETGVAGTAAETAALNAAAADAAAASALSATADASFIADMASSMGTTDVAAIQQNLIAAGVDPIVAAEAANGVGLGLTGDALTATVLSAAPAGASTLITSIPTEQALYGGITQSSPLDITKTLRAANSLTNLFGKPTSQPMSLLQPQRQITPSGSVDYSGYLSLLGSQIPQTRNSLV